MNAHLGTLPGGWVLDDLLRARQQRDYQGYQLTLQRFSSELVVANPCGRMVDRFAQRNGMLVLNGHAELDALGTATMVW